MLIFLKEDVAIRIKEGDLLFCTNRNNYVARFLILNIFEAPNGESVAKTYDVDLKQIFDWRPGIMSSIKINIFGDL